MVKYKDMKEKNAPYTPMMMQYLGIKEKYPDTLIFFRLGDFYELFFDDAKTASQELGLVLTGKNAGSEERVPMCGVPHHSSKNYIAKLIHRGYKVGIVEQLSDPSSKGIVDRDVTQIYTPGAFIESLELEHNFIVSLAWAEHQCVAVYLDISTGDVFVESLEPSLTSIQSLIVTRAIKEIVVSHQFPKTIREGLISSLNVLVTIQDAMSIVDIPPQLHTDEQEAYQRLISYLENTQKRSLTHLKNPQRIDPSTMMMIDDFSIANLELIHSLKHRGKYGSLYWLLDETNTPMGSRYLKEMLLHPLTDAAVIESRLNIVEAFNHHFLVAESIKQSLKTLYDIPRIITRLHYQTANGRDLLSLKKSLKELPSIRMQLMSLQHKDFLPLITQLPTQESIVNLIEHAIDDDAPVTIKEGGVIKKGYDPSIDELIELATGGKKKLLELEMNERERTGIKNLKVGFNKVFGYYIEISNGQLSSVKPEYQYERRQTLTNGERFVTPELKALEIKLLTAEEQRVKQEEALFLKILAQLLPETKTLQMIASTLAYIDVLLAFSTVSGRYMFTRPTFTKKRIVDIQESRHPVIEKVMQSSRFVSNDILMDEQTHTLLITGPNMGGKSTFMRQVALTVILAQIGCFVPAKKAHMMIFDAIYTRIGATDDLVGGQSTFMMEMAQTNYALTHATDKSLLIFDEIGRGTATFDGMALAQAIIEYVIENIQSKTLFSTHYHELTHLSQTVPTLKNIHAAVVEVEDNITFLYKLKQGAMNQSYGINVAKLAHLPEGIIHRAKTILLALENQPTQKVKPIQSTIKETRVSPVEKMLSTIDVNALTPLEALQVLDSLKKKIK
jgi:DNA mismatch repair protein MutS